MYTNEVGIQITCLYFTNGTDITKTYCIGFQIKQPIYLAIYQCLLHYYKQYASENTFHTYIAFVIS